LGWKSNNLDIYISNPKHSLPKLINEISMIIFVSLWIMNKERNYSKSHLRIKQIHSWKLRKIYIICRMQQTYYNKSNKLPAFSLEQTRRSTSIEHCRKIYFWPAFLIWKFSITVFDYQPLIVEFRWRSAQYYLTVSKY
jgi:hypothetical protein